MTANRAWWPPSNKPAAKSRARAYLEKFGGSPTAATQAEVQACFDAHPGLFSNRRNYQLQGLGLETRISDGGVISYPLLGAVRVGGLKVGDAQAAIANGLKKGDFVNNPQVVVVLMQARGSQVSVPGQVNRPGRYAQEQAGTRLTDVLALASGLLPNMAAGVVTIVGTRNGQPYRAPVIYIYGEVQRPGQVRLERDMTLLQGLAAGGGLTLRGTEKGIRLDRRSVEGKLQEMQPGMSNTLRDGGVIFVRESLF